MVAEDDRVATQWSFIGTHNGELMGIPRTGKQITASGITIQRFADGKIAEGWTNFDLLGLLQQLSVIPSPDESVARLRSVAHNHRRMSSPYISAMTGVRGGSSASLRTAHR
jgi:hypothetical protein